MSKQKILAVDDESDILELLRYNLEREGFDVCCVSSGENCVEKAKDFKPDLILLDLMLPGIDGLKVCKILKADVKTSHIPIVMLTAKGEEADIVLGLELGADDYIPKPFSTKVLIARVKTILRRVHTTVSDDSDAKVLKRDKLVINTGRREASYSGKELDLTFTEFEILYMLAKRPGWVFTRNQIVSQVKGDDYPVTERAIDVQIVGLRKKLGGSENLIETIRGVGYRFKDH